MKYVCMYFSLLVFCEGAEYFGVSFFELLLEFLFFCFGIGLVGVFFFFLCIIRRVFILLLIVVRLVVFI